MIDKWVVTKNHYSSNLSSFICSAICFICFLNIFFLLISFSNLHIYSNSLKSFSKVMLLTVFSVGISSISSSLFILLFSFLLKSSLTSKSISKESVLLSYLMKLIVFYLKISLLLFSSWSGNSAYLIAQLNSVYFLLFLGYS